MPTRLEQAFSEAAKLPLEEQNLLAEWLLAELRSEKRWEKLFADSQDLLSQMAAKALAEHRSGRTKDLDPSQI